MSGIKKEIAEIKFLIHDLRVESFVNEIIHFHVTVDTDLEIYNVDQAQAIHGDDLIELKAQAVKQRKAYQAYCDAVTNLSPDKTVLAAGRKYVETVQTTCEMILDPRWGRAAKVLTFLPEKSRSVRSHLRYMNCIRWICGVEARIQHFFEEKFSKEILEHFDVSQEIDDFVRSVIYGYVEEKSGAKVHIQLDRLDPGTVLGNRYRFRRMFFNLVMNAVDAMAEKTVGILNINVTADENQLLLRVSDNGAGMTPEKIKQLMEKQSNLDGELHSLGFVFVRQTIGEFNGELKLDSKVGRGTTVTITLPYEVGVEATAKPAADCEDVDLLHDLDDVRQKGKTALAKKVAGSGADPHGTCGEMVYADYFVSDGQPHGAIFAMGITDKGKVDFFTHRPYERDWNITHEDLSPMLFESTVRGRLEEDEGVPVLILKAPLNVREYFDFREVPDDKRDGKMYIDMIHDEYIRIARKLTDTGLPADLEVRVTDLKKFFPNQEDLLKADPFPITLLAGQKLNAEEKGE
ncbi:MAG: ATP-binding protein [Candidatus Latescibacterota bacterium]